MNGSCFSLIPGPTLVLGVEESVFLLLDEEGLPDFGCFGWGCVFHQFDTLPLLSSGSAGRGRVPWGELLAERFRSFESSPTAMGSSVTCQVLAMSPTALSKTSMALDPRKPGPGAAFSGLDRAGLMDAGVGKRMVMPPGPDSALILGFPAI